LNSVSSSSVLGKLLSDELWHWQQSRAQQVDAGPAVHLSPKRL
jgi:hypothetical protein